MTTGRTNTPKVVRPQYGKAITMSGAYARLAILFSEGSPSARPSRSANRGVCRTLVLRQSLTHRAGLRVLLGHDILESACGGVAFEASAAAEFGSWLQLFEALLAAADAALIPKMQRWMPRCASLTISKSRLAFPHAST
jgi:hypothetical protein